MVCGGMIMSGESFALEVKKLHKRFAGVHALKGVNFQLKPGEVHALVGENGAGKSTLMKCIFGVEIPNEGEVLIEGKTVKISRSSDALEKGIAMIHQELNPVPYRTVAENIYLGLYPTKYLPFIVDHKKMNEDSKKLFDTLGIDINPKSLVVDLSVSQIQMLEIAKATRSHAKVIIMDEPTSSLTDNEVAHLFKIIKKLKSDNVAVVYISHKMEEIKTICDAVTIMRDGEYIGRWDIAELTIDDIIAKMVGRKLDNRFPPKNYEKGRDTILEVKNFTSYEASSFKDVSFDLKKGEILGVGGLVGAQRTELMESVFGLRPHKGDIIINGEKKSIHSSIDAIKHHFALLTEERRVTGILGCLSIEENMLVASYPRFSVGKMFINEKRNLHITKEYIQKLNIKTPSTKTLIQNLSGGNQQKVLIARWLLTLPDILILDEPTRGIDVGAKYEVYSLMYELAREGKAIIMISSEMPELMGVSDRIMVMSNGHLAGMLEKEQFSQEKIMDLATSCF